MPPKRAQRTKGNVKPSSSSQAAQLLAASGQAPTGFIGFGSQPAFVPASEVLEDSDFNLDADFRLALRKLSKKDTTTKIKALQEFAILCQNKSDQCVNAVLPFWPRLYNKVAIDVDHKVRELSQKALASLTSRVGKAVAPYLKSLMGYWMVCMCDTYPTVASAANSAFVSTFPGAKQAEALRFCKMEIMECLMTVILKHSAQTLSDPLTTSEEDMEAKYLRTVGSSLQALRKLMSALSSESVSSHLGPQLSTLLSSPTFWKHASCRDDKVKASVLGLLSSVCQMCPEVSGQHLAKLTPLVFSQLTALDTGLVSAAWEALLALVNAHKKCWEHINWQKAAWPKLKQTLETGCGGHAPIIAPCLLPLLSCVPQDKLSLTQFFDAFRLGLSEDSVLNSPSTCASLVRSFMECVQYSITRDCPGGTGDRTPLVRKLLEDQVLVVMQASLSHPRASLSRTELYCLVSPMLACAGNLDPCIEEDFWTDLSEFVRMQLCGQFATLNDPVLDKTVVDSSPVKTKSSPPVTTEQFASRLTAVLCGLVYRESPSSHKKERVRFGAREEQSSTIAFEGKEKQPLSSGMEKFISDIMVSSYTLAHLQSDKRSQFFRTFKDLAAVHILPSVPQRLTLRLEDKVARQTAEDLGHAQLAKFSTDSVLSLVNSLKSKLQVTRAGEDGDGDSRVDPFTEFVCEDLVQLLLCDGTKESALPFASQDIVHVFFHFLSCMKDSAGQEVLMLVVDHLTSPVLTCQLMEQILKQAHRVPACELLLKGPALGRKIETFALGVMTGGFASREDELQAAVWAMLTSVVSSMEEVDSPLFSQSCMDAVTSLCKATLKKLQGEKVQAVTLEAVVGLVRALFLKHKLSVSLPMGDLMQGLMGVLLTCHLEEQESAASVRACLGEGLRLVLAERAHEEGRQLVQGLSAQLSHWTSTQLHTSHSLSQLNDVSFLLLECLVGGTSQEEGAESGPDGDFSLASDTCDRLLVGEAQPLEGQDKVMDYLYISGELLSLPDVPSISPAEASLPLAHYCLLALHRCRVLSTWRGLTSRQFVEEKVWSDARLLVLGQLCRDFVLIQTASLLNPKSEEVKPGEVLAELRTECLCCLNSLSKPLTAHLMDLFLQGESASSQCQVLGLQTGLSWVLTCPHQSQATLHSCQEALHRLHTLFVTRCLPAQSSPEVHGILSQAPLAGRSVCEALALSLTLVTSQGDNLEQLADCVSGILSLASTHSILTQDVKLSLFQQLHTTVSQLKDQGSHLLGPTDTEASVERLHYNRSVAEALRLLVVAGSEPFWEFCLCTLVEWVLFLCECPREQPSSQALAASVCRLAHSVAQVFASPPVASPTGGTAGDTDAAVTEKSKTEWDEFFSEGLFSPLLSLFVNIASHPPGSPADPAWSVVLTPLAGAASLCPAPQVLGHTLPALLTVTDRSALPDSLKSAMNHVGPLLTARHRGAQVAAFCLMEHVISEVPKHEAEAGGDTEGEEEEMRCPPEGIVHVCERASHYLDALMVARVDEHMEVDPGTEEHAQALGYLLAWRLLLQLFRSSPNQLRAKYAQYFKQQDSVNHLLDHLFRLIPTQPSPALLDFPHSMDAAGVSSMSELPQLALMVYRQCLETLPALVRLWWADQDRKSSHFIDKFTSVYLSTGLIYQQIASSQSEENNMEGITIRARPAAREVCATYAMAEVTVTMSIVLPENFPLGKLEVACDKRVGVSQAQWDRWLLQLNIFLQHQNGSIVEGLRLWKGNLDKKFEGVDDCMVCFSVIHGTTFQLPRLTCKTCRKKFHSSCLYKWFSTSQKSSCPMCRNLF